MASFIIPPAARRRQPGAQASFDTDEGFEPTRVQESARAKLERDREIRIFQTFALGYVKAINEFSETTQREVTEFSVLNNDEKKAHYKTTLDRISDLFRKIHDERNAFCEAEALCPDGTIKEKQQQRVDTSLKTSHFKQRLKELAKLQNEIVQFAHENNLNVPELIDADGTIIPKEPTPYVHRLLPTLVQEVGPAVGKGTLYGMLYSAATATWIPGSIGIGYAVHKEIYEAAKPFYNPTQKALASTYSYVAGVASCVATYAAATFLSPVTPSALTQFPKENPWLMSLPAAGILGYWALPSLWASSKPKPAKEEIDWGSSLPPERPKKKEQPRSLRQKIRGTLDTIKSAKNIPVVDPCKKLLCSPEAKIVTTVNLGYALYQTNAALSQGDFSRATVYSAATLAAATTLKLQAIGSTSIYDAVTGTIKSYTPAPIRRLCSWFVRAPAPAAAVPQPKPVVVVEDTSDDEKN